MKGIFTSFHCSFYALTSFVDNGLWMVIRTYMMTMIMDDAEDDDDEWMDDDDGNDDGWLNDAKCSIS